MRLLGTTVLVPVVAGLAASHSVFGTVPPLQPAQSDPTCSLCRSFRLIHIWRSGRLCRSDS